MAIEVKKKQKRALNTIPLAELGLASADVKLMRDAGIPDNIRAAFDALKTTIYRVGDVEKADMTRIPGISVEVGNRIEAALMSYPDRPEDVKDLFGESGQSVDPQVVPSSAGEHSSFFQSNAWKDFLKGLRGGK